MMEGSKIASSNRRCCRECSVGMASLLCCLSLSTVIIGSLPVQWGRCNMVDAERQLLTNALLDLSNDRFVLLSESCIPLFNFPTVYHHLTASSLSFVGSFDDPSKAGRGRYSPRMHPIVTLADRRYYPVFREHCRPPCYVDEHYLPTLVTKLFPGINSNKSLTWVDWSRGGAHPATYRRRDVSVGLMERTRNGYSNNTTNTTTMCFLLLQIAGACQASQGLKSW